MLSTRYVLESARARVRWVSGGDVLRQSNSNSNNNRGGDAIVWWVVVVEVGTIGELVAPRTYHRREAAVGRVWKGVSEELVMVVVSWCGGGGGRE